MKAQLTITPHDGKQEDAIRRLVTEFVASLPDRIRLKSCKVDFGGEGDAKAKKVSAKK